MTPQTEQRIIEDLAYLKATQKDQTKTLGELRYAMYGNGEPGMKVKVDRHDQTLKYLVKAGWIVLTPILAAVGVGILYLLAHSTP